MAPEVSQKYFSQDYLCFGLNVIICNSGFCNQVLLSGLLIIRSLTMPFKPFLSFIEGYCWNSDAVTKCFMEKIHRKAVEAVTTAHIKMVAMWDLAHTNLKQGIVQPLRPLNQPSRFLLLTGRVNVCQLWSNYGRWAVVLCLPKEYGNKISEGGMKQKGRGCKTSKRMTQPFEDMT